MFEAMAIGATGMQAQQMHLDTIANNLANMNTPAYKKSRVAFSELLVAGAAQRPGPDAFTHEALPLAGAGVGLATATRLFEAGELRKTEQPLDVAIQGEGFLELAMPDGSRAYSRGGSLRVNAEGLLATAAGVPLRPGIHVPEGAEAVLVAPSGRVQVRMPGESRLVEAGQLELVRFIHPGGLQAEAGGVYRASEASGEALSGRAGEEGLGTLAQGFLEGSNVKLVEEMVQLMVAQRAYEASVKVVQAADDLLGLINGLRR
jgi:flagellar basal-body rod protein FlgG